MAYNTNSLCMLFSWCRSEMNKRKQDGELKVMDSAEKKQKNQDGERKVMATGEKKQKQQDEESGEKKQKKQDEESGEKKQKKPTDHRLLKDVNPAVFAELDQTLNPKVDINKVEVCCTKKLWWRCREHKTCDEHVWEKSVAKRLAGKFGCRYCYKNHNQLFCKCATARGEGRLLYISHPKIFAEIDRRHHKDEEELKKLPTNSKLRLHFRCNKEKCEKCGREHVWDTTVQSRTQGLGGCPWCTKHAKLFCRCVSFASRPDLLAQLHPTQNEKFDPETVPFSSGRLFTWKCDNHKTCDLHVWKSSIGSRVYQDKGCTWCAHHHGLFCECDSLAMHELAKELDKEANEKEGIDPRKLTWCSTTRVNWVCSTCEHHWNTLANQRTSAGTGCPKCAENQTKSRMERACENKLKELKVDYDDEKPFPTCRDVGMLKFDFFVPAHRLLIELDGGQHFTRTPWFHKTLEEFQDLQRRDAIKTKWAKDNGYKLLRISCSHSKEVGLHVEKMVDDLSKNNPINQRFVGKEYETPEYRLLRFDDPTNSPTQAVIFVQTGSIGSSASPTETIEADGTNQRNQSK